ncbi:hypothetical protein MVEN_01324500 [Mycena venus]|uniref:VIT domain-containing protein n=1 Tax=Mycena venus TaxID=2733690 RepID=A0A8H7CTV2_9AGAR|nr:hypothetical protein MVEN_01324500 [Mycena venus]
MYGLYYAFEKTVLSLPLLSVHAAASIKELAAQVNLTQTYRNDAKFPIEAKYSFPIPARAAVSSFTMIKQDGTRVVGSVLEKFEARKTYDAAVSHGQQASLMEQQTPDVFQVAVGNIPSNEQVQIELIYSTELGEDEENDSVRFHLPVHIGARYGQTPADFTPAPSSSSPFLTISATVEALAPISSIGSPTHKVSTEMGPDPSLPNFKDLPFSNYARVSLSSSTALDKDFVLTFKSTGLDAPRCVAEHHPTNDTTALALTFVPRFTLPDLERQEFILVVDRSGSMEGGGSRTYNAATLKDATQHVDAMDADYGGTEIRSALEHAFAHRARDRPTSVLVLTDGDAWDLDGVLDTVKRAVAAAPEDAPLRVSVLGIGDSVSTAMKKSFAGKIARLLKAARTPLLSNITVDWGRGPAELEARDDFEVVVEAGGSEETPQNKTLNVFDVDVDPTLLDETPPPPAPPVVLPPPPPVQQSPFKIRNLFPGSRVNMYAILQGQTVPETVTLRGLSPDGAHIELTIPVTLSRLPDAANAPPALHALTARKIIQDLEDGQHELTVNITDADLVERTVRAHIVRLGTAYQIASTHTSFVAVDESQAWRPRYVQDAAQSSPEPDAAWDGEDALEGVVMHDELDDVYIAPMAQQNFFKAAPRKYVSPASATRSYGYAVPQWEASKNPTFLERILDRLSSIVSLHSASPSSSPPPTSGKHDTLEAFARLQAFDGSFPAPIAVLALVRLQEGTTLADVRAALPGADDDELVGTTLALALLRMKMNSVDPADPDQMADAPAWVGMHEKAQAWLEAALGARGAKETAQELEIRVAEMLEHKIMFF